MPFGGVRLLQQVVASNHGCLETSEKSDYGEQANNDSMDSVAKCWSS